MRINFDMLDLRAFLAVLDQGGFHKAAELLALSQPALSRRIQALEQAVGAPLLERTTRHVAASAAGRRFAPLARRLLEELEAEIAALSGLDPAQGGQITLACVPTAAFYFLPGAIARFAATYPKIRFRILDLSANDGLAAVARGEAEFGITLAGGTDPGLVFTPLLQDPFVLACRRDHGFASRRHLGWGDLDGQSLIGVSRASGNRMILENALAEAGVRLHFHYEVNHLTTSLGLVERGLGLSVLPRLATPSADHPAIAVRPIGKPAITRTIGLVERRAARLSPAAQRFRDMLVKA